MKIIISFLRIIAIGFGLFCISFDVLGGIGTYQSKTLSLSKIIILIIILLVGFISLKLGFSNYVSKEEREALEKQKERELQIKKQEEEARKREEEARKRIEKSLNYLISSLAKKGFKFLQSKTLGNSMQEQLSEFDDKRLGMYNKFFGFMISGSDIPEFAKTISENFIGFGAEKTNDEELEQIQLFIMSKFPLSAITSNQLYGLRFLAVVNGDLMEKTEIFDSLDSFQEINYCMIVLGGRLSVNFFGMSLKVDSSAATGSIIFMTSTTEKAQLIRQWLSEKPLHSDTILNQLKKRISSPKFWLKAVVGIIEYTPNQLRQEAIVLDAQSEQATSTISPRIGFEFGFSLDEVTIITNKLS